MLFQSITPEPLGLLKCYVKFWFEVQFPLKRCFGFVCLFVFSVVSGFVYFLVTLNTCSQLLFCPQSPGDWLIQVFNSCSREQYFMSTCTTTLTLGTLCFKFRCIVDFLVRHSNCRCCYFQTPSVVHCMNATASAQSPKVLQNFYPQTIFCQLLQVTRKRSCTFAGNAQAQLHFRDDQQRAFGISNISNLARVSVNFMATQIDSPISYISYLVAHIVND